MKLSRQKFWGLLILLLFGLPLVITGGLIYRGNRQQIVNRALITAIRKNDMSAVNSLLAKGADPDARDWPPYMEFLGNSSWRGRSHPSEPEPALNAASHGQTEAVVLLLAKGGTVNARDSSGTAPLAYAMYVGDKDCVQALIVGGAQVNMRDGSGDTPLAFAVRYDRAAFVRLLLAGGALVNAKNKDGQTPLNFVAPATDPSIINMLKQAGAK